MFAVHATGVSKGDTTIPERKKVQAPYGARVQAAIGLTPLAAPVPPTERAGSEGVMYAADRRLYTHRPKGDTTPSEPFEPFEPSEPSRPKGVSKDAPGPSDISPKEEYNNSIS